jgi:hypothetical protein
MPGDPIATKIFRNPDSWILDGVDVGTEHILPKLIKYNLGPGNAVNHSCKIYASGMAIAMTIKGGYPTEDYELIGTIFKKSIN